MNDYFISTNKDLLDIQKIWSLLKDCFWSKDIPVEYVARFIKYSLCFGIFTQDKQQVGFGRIISDYTTYAYICDVIVEPNHRNKGLARELIKNMLNHPELQGLKTWSLVSTKEAKKIYKENGFLPVGNICEALEITNLNIYAEEGFVNLHRLSSKNNNEALY